jgi:hypothetical protein
VRTGGVGSNAGTLFWRIGRRVILCMLLIAALAVIWNLLGRMNEAAN